MRWVALALVVLGGWGAHLLQARLDETRHSGVDRHELMVIPGGQALRAAAMGYDSLVADMLWARAVLVYGELLGKPTEPARLTWLGKMILAVVELDPTWRTPYYYGATLLSTSGAVDASDAVLLAAIEQMPEDSYFPFALGMNHYIHREDAEAAGEWIRMAAALPGAPDWYEMAARGLVVKKLGLESAIRYLREEIASTEDPDLRAQLETRLDDVVHQRWVEELEDARADAEAKLGRPLSSLDELVTLGAAPQLPEDPLGGTWMINVDGDVTSTVAEEAFTAQQLRWERRLLSLVLD